MRISLFRQIVSSLFIAILSLALAGCSGKGGGKNLDGVYHAASGGPITITIKGSKAIFQIAGESKTMDYKVVGNKLTILNPQEGDVEFTINDDGTLSGQLGLMTKMH
jgi:uncharacterized lipoprotein YehR (DUF1307 family)